MESLKELTDIAETILFQTKDAKGKKEMNVYLNSLGQIIKQIKKEINDTNGRNKGTP
jgi:hypothetical protein